jgi:acetyltransferase-like isoleucine patch superfamily enzyme
MQMKQKIRFRNIANKLSRIIRSLILFSFPSKLAIFIVNNFGYKIKSNAKIGFSWIDVENLIIHDQCIIGHFNVVRGPFSVIMADHSKIGHFNTIRRGGRGFSTGSSTLALGKYAIITLRHRLDLTMSISIGNYSVVAGSGSQFWTHGYIHGRSGLDRYRLDGSISLGENVYIGSMCFISMGVTVSDGVIVGGGSSVGKSLSAPALYVSSGLRCLPRPQDPDLRPDLILLEDKSLQDKVYKKIDNSIN